MTKRVIFLIPVLLLWFSHSPAADPFYTNLLNEGKALYLAGQYDEALENYKIAEFGLIDEKEIVPELYFYYALTQYRKGAVAESQALLAKLKAILAGADIAKLAKPKEIERELSIMLRAMDYLAQPGAKPGSLPFFNLFYETWDLLKEKKLPLAEANLKRLEKMSGDEKRLLFLAGLLAFEKGDYKKCLNRLEKIGPVLPAEFGEQASFCLAYSFLKRGDAASSEKYARLIKDPGNIHRLMDLMDEVKASQQPKNKKK